MIQALHTRTMLWEVYNFMQNIEWINTALICDNARAKRKFLLLNGVYPLCIIYIIIYIYVYNVYMVDH